MVQKSVHRKLIPLPRHMQFPPEIMSLEGVAISDTTKAGLFDLDHESVMFAQNIHEKSISGEYHKN